MTKQEAIRILEQSCPKRPQKLWSIKRKEAVKMAIEALQRGLENVNADSCSEKPNRSDLISRQAAIDALGGEPLDFDEYEQGLHAMWQDAKESLERLPSAEPEVLACGNGELDAQSERWIPCSKRLPENRRYVLVTYQYEYGLIDHGITWYGEAEKKWDTSRNVIAWMPLPEPYTQE